MTRITRCPLCKGTGVLLDALRCPCKAPQTPPPRNVELPTQQDIGSMFAVCVEMFRALDTPPPVELEGFEEDMRIHGDLIRLAPDAATVQASTGQWMNQAGGWTQAVFLLGLEADQQRRSLAGALVELTQMVKSRILTKPLTIEIVKE